MSGAFFSTNRTVEMLREINACFTWGPTFPYQVVDPFCGAGTVLAIATNHDGSLLVVGGESKIIELWAIPTNNLPGIVPVLHFKFLCASIVHSLALTQASRGYRCATCCVARAKWVVC